MRSVLFLLIGIILSSLKGYSQCYCGKIYFQMVLTGIKTKGEDLNYTLKVQQGLPKYLPTGEEEKFTKADLKGDTVKFHFHTGGGIDSLTFFITNLTEKTKMRVTVTHLRYDKPYFIDLTTFTPGQFLFDWRKIIECQSKHISQELIQCDGKKFYQLELKADSVVHTKIKPVDIKQFQSR